MPRLGKPVWKETRSCGERFNAAFAALIAVSRGGYDPWDAANAAGYAVEFLTGTPKDAEHVLQVAFVLDDLFGNPFRPVTLDPAWRTPGVIALARTIYADPAFNRMPELADALEQAGCISLDILAHCRQPCEHVRGCWVADLLLEKG
jgi:hypothetical protein